MKETQSGSVDPAFENHWTTDIEQIRATLSRHSPEFVHTGIGVKWATYRRKPSGSLQRVVSRYLPLRETREEAERDLYVWLWR